jgi:outer membrane protein
MQYAVEHNTQVRRAALELDNYKASKLSAIGSFLPAASGNIGMQYNFGRAIDPETNTYTDVSTFPTAIPCRPRCLCLMALAE